MPIIYRWLLSALTIMLAAQIIPGVHVASFWSSLWIAVILGFFNALIRPILIIVTLPINIATLGLFTLVINGLLVLLASSIIAGFSVEGFFSAMFFSLAVSLISFLINRVIEK